MCRINLLKYKKTRRIAKLLYKNRYSNSSNRNNNNRNNKTIININNNRNNNSIKIVIVYIIKICIRGYPDRKI